MAPPRHVVARVLGGLLAVVAARGTAGARWWQPEFQYEYSYEATSHMHESDLLTTTATLVVRPFVRAENGEITCSLEVHGFDQRSRRLEDHADYDLGTNGLEYGRWFSFTVSRHGDIVSVQHESGESPLVLTAKKSFAGILSARLHPPEVDLEGSWSYDAEEVDHSGAHTSVYEARRAGEETIYTKTAMPSVPDYLERNHTRSYVLHHEAGVLHSARSVDVVVAGDGNSPTRVDETEFRDDVGFDDTAAHAALVVPDMKSTGESVLTLQTYTRQTVLPKPPPSLVTASPEVGLPAPGELTTEEARLVTRDNVDCTQMPGNKGPKSSECFHNLTTILRRLTAEQLWTVTEDYFSAGQEVARLELVVDAMAHVPSSAAQEIILERVLTAAQPQDDELARRALIGLATTFQLEAAVPLPRLVARLEQFAYEPDTVPAALQTSHVAHQSLLVLGIAARRLSVVNAAEADRLVGAMESRLEYHSPDFASQDRQRRSQAEAQLANMEVDHPEFEAVAAQAYGADPMEERRMVLLESLGNSHMPRCVPMIASHANASASPELRRASVSALRHFKCAHSAHALLRTAVTDPWADIRRVASAQYAGHPLAMPPDELNSTIATAEAFHGDPHLVPNSTQQLERVRQRRRSFMDLLKSLSFKLELPKVTWDKQLGNKKLGADMGLFLENRLQLEIDDLAGGAEIVVDNRAWIVANVGIIKKSFDVMRAEACYKGGVGYDLNFLKDFGIDNIFEVVTKFDRIVNAVISRVKGGFDSFIDRIDNSIVTVVRNGVKRALSGGIKALFTELVTAVKELPARFGEGGGLISQLLQKLQSYSAIPAVASISRAVRRMRNFYDSVVGDVTSFYHAVVDSVTVELPWAAKQMWTAVQRLWGAVKSLFKTPVKSVAEVASSVFRIKTAVKVILTAKKRVSDALFNRNGGTWWLNLGKRMKGFLADLRDIGAALRDLWTAAKAKENAVGAGCQGTLNVATQRRRIFEDLKDTVSAILGPMESFQNLVTPFVQAWKNTLGIVKDLKAGFLSLKQGVDTGQALILKVFGPRFDEAFPRQIRDCVSGCDCGNYPTKSGSDFYPGIDVELAEGEEVVCPFDGIVYSIPGRDEIVVEPANFLLRNKKVIISNVRADAAITLVGTYIAAGTKVGSATRSKCQPNFLHVALVKRKAEDVDELEPPEGNKQEKKRSFGDALNDLTGGVLKSGDGVMDPTGFTKKKGFPIPKWVQACDSYKLVIAGSTVGSGKISEAAQKLKSALKRAPEQGTAGGPGRDEQPEPEGTAEKGKLRETLKGKMSEYKSQLEQKFQEGLASYEVLPSDPDPWSKFSGAHFAPLGSSDDLQPKKFSFQQIGGSTAGPLNGFCVDCMTVSEVSQVLADAEIDASCLEGLVGALVERIRPKETCLHPFFLSDYHLRRRLGLLGRPNDGSHSELVERLSTPPPDACPTQSGVVPSTLNSCSMDADCRGVTCCVRVRQVYLEATVPVALRVYPCQDKLAITVNAATQEVSIKEDGEHIWSPGGGLNGTNTSSVGLGEDECQMSPFVTVSWAIRDESDDVRQKMLEVDLSVRLCEPRSLSCVDATAILVRQEFTLATQDDPTCDSDGTGGELPDASLRVNATKIADFEVQLRHNDIDARCLPKMMADVREALIDEFAVAVDNAFNPGDGEFPKEVFDICIPGTIRFPTKSVTFFEPPGITIMAGPVPITFRFAAAGSFGMSIGLRFCILSMSVEVVLTPWAGVDLSGSMEVNLLAFHAGVRLTGRLLQTKFPVAATLSFAKFPLQVGLRMDMEMIPIGFALDVFCQVGVKIFGIKVVKTLVRVTLWKWSMAAIEANIFDTKKPESNPSPPDFTQVGTALGSVARPTDRCEVQQLPGRDPSDPAYKLEFSVADDRSNIVVTYSVGTSPGGDDVAKDVEMGGQSIIGNDPDLPNGVPLFFTVKAANTDGGQASVGCHIETLDNTLPEGRFVADHELSSNPTILSGSLLVRDDSTLASEVLEGVGVGRGKFAGDGVAEFKPYSLAEMELEAKEASGDLGRFAPARPGQLFGSILRKGSGTSAECAAECVLDEACLSFDHDSVDECVFHHGYAETTADLHVTHEAAWEHFERLLSGHGAVFSHTGLNMKHNSLNFLTAIVTNVLGYEAAISSQGTRMDLTPPETAELVRVRYDEMLAHGCKAAPTQRCVDVTPTPNHRVVIDGLGSKAVWNGLEPGVELRYSRDAHMVAANWDGFHDEESGIHNYVWGVGSSPCEDDIWPFQDPHLGHASRDDWTHMGVAHPLGDNETGLPEGKYYASVSALNGIVHGGALVTTVCHGVPFAVDTTPPIVVRVWDFHFIDANRVAVRYDAYDNQSDIAAVEVALGRTRYDTDLMNFTRGEWNPEQIARVHLGGQEVTVQDGDVMWAVLKAINGVDLSTIGVADEPILVDFTPPSVGVVADGDKLHVDAVFSNSPDTLCANWDHFVDPDSQILRYDVLFSGSDTPAEFGSIWRHGCAEGLELVHNRVYKATVTAYNHGHLRLSASATTDGVLVDLTAPDISRATALDGLKGEDEWQFRASPAHVAANWQGVVDPESKVVKYEVSVSGKLAGVIQKPYDIGLATHFSHHHYHLQHGDEITTQIHATNGAGSRSEALKTNSFKLDLTPPVVEALFVGGESSNDLFNADAATPTVSWTAADPESGIAQQHVRLVVLFQGQKKFFPNKPAEVDRAATTYAASGVAVGNGARYYFEITATNGVDRIARVDSAVAVMDTTPPVITHVVAGAMDGEEVAVDPISKAVETSQNDAVEAWWAASDDESGLASYQVAVGTSASGTDVLAKKDVGLATNALLSGFPALSVGKRYYVTVWAKNRAGLTSAQSSTPLLIVAKDRPGHVLDGWPNSADISVQPYSHTITATFAGFFSSTGIAAYEWAVGTQAGATDTLSFTSVGLLVDDAGVGQGQIPLPLRSGQEYWVTVRAVTGAKDLLDATSSGVLVDATPPEVSVDAFSVVAPGLVTSLPQAASWQADDDGSALLPQLKWWVGSYPGGADLHPVTTTADNGNAGSLIAADACKDSSCGGLPVFVSVSASNVAGLTSVATGSGVSVDSTEAELGSIACDPWINSQTSQVRCRWTQAIEEESTLLAGSVKVHVLSGITEADLNVTGDASTLHRNDFDVFSVPVDTAAASAFVVVITATNAVGFESETSSNLIREAHTVPVPGSVRILPDVWNTVSDDPAHCQRSHGVVVSWDGFLDFYGGLTYSVAVGSSSGASDIQDFVPAGEANTLHLSNLNVVPGERIFASVRAHSVAGLQTTVVSDHVVVSDRPVYRDQLKVLDGEDVDSVTLHLSQQESVSLSVRWQQGGCSPTNVKAGLFSLHGEPVADFFDVQDPSPRGDGWYAASAHGLSLQLHTKYYWVVRAENCFGGLEVGRSEGVTIWPLSPPLPGDVVDGLSPEDDLAYQASATQMSASWTAFGDGGFDSYQQIDYYEVAVGSDVFSHAGRTSESEYARAPDGVFSFTVSDLDLTPGGTYYVTVRATTLSGLSSFVSSSGVVVGFTETLVAGRVDVAPFQADPSTISAAWSGFESELELEYKWALVSGEATASTRCDSSLPGMVLAFASVGADTAAAATGLTLVGGQRYTVVVQGSTAAGGCIQSMSASSLVDDSEPVTGTVVLRASSRARRSPTDPWEQPLEPVLGGEGAVGSAFLAETLSVTLALRGFADAESGLDRFSVGVRAALSCAASDADKLEQVVEPFDVGGDQDHAVLSGVPWQSGRPYYVVVRAYNKAGLHSEVTTAPVFADTATPAPGRVFDGDTVNVDRVFQSSTSKLEAVFTQSYDNSYMRCPSHRSPLTSPGDGWQPYLVEDSYDGQVVKLIDETQVVTTAAATTTVATTSPAPATSTDPFVNSSNFTDPGEAVNGTATTPSSSFSPLSSTSTTTRPEPDQPAFAFSDAGVIIGCKWSLQEPYVASQLFVKPAPSREPDGGSYSITLRTGASKKSVSSWLLYGGTEVTASVVRHFRHGRVENPGLLVDLTTDQQTEQNFSALVNPNTTATTDGPLTSGPDSAAGILDIPVQTAEGDPGQRLVIRPGVTVEVDDVSVKPALLGIEVEGQPERGTDGVLRWPVLFWCSFVGGLRQEKSEVVWMDADPTLEFHVYALRLFRQDFGTIRDWSAELSIDGEPVASLLGVPEFADHTSMVLHEWNRFSAVGEFPGTRPGDARLSELVARDALFPAVAESQVCGPGASFFSPGSPIGRLRAYFVDEADTADAARSQFYDLDPPCTPCGTPDSCSRFACDPSCDNEQREWQVEINGLSLGAQRVESNWTAFDVEAKVAPLEAGDLGVVGVDMLSEDAAVLHVVPLVDLGPGQTVELTTREYDESGFYFMEAYYTNRSCGGNTTAAPGQNCTTTTTTTTTTTGPSTTSTTTAATTTTEGSNGTTTATLASSTSATTTTTAAPTTTTTTTVDPVRKFRRVLKPGRTMTVTLSDGEIVKAGTLIRVPLGGLLPAGRGNLTNATFVFYVGSPDNASLVHAMTVGSRKRAVPTDELANSSNVVLPSLVMAYTRGPLVARKVSLASDLTTPRYWQAAAESFDPFEAGNGFPERLFVIDADYVERDVAEYLQADQVRLTVEAQTLSGRVFGATSTGVIVDETPPRLVYAHHFLPGQLPSRPTKLQQSQWTIAASYLFADDESGVAAYSWQIGTRPGGSDVLPRTTLGTSEVATVDGLSLRDKQTYYATVTACNRAQSCTSVTIDGGVTVDLDRPDFSGMRGVVSEGDDLETVMVSSVPILTTTNNEHVSIRWDGIGGDIEQVTWELGTEFGASDILRPVFVGPGPNEGGHKGWAEVRDGYLFVGEDKARADQRNLGSMVDVASVDNTDIDQAQNVGVLMRLPPGVCVYHRLTAYTAALVASEFDAVACVMLDGHVILTPVNGTFDFTLFKSGDVLATNTSDPQYTLGRDRRRAAAEGPEGAGGVVTDGEQVVDDGITMTFLSANNSDTTAMMGGLLTPQQLASRYAGAGSVVLKSYIADPRTTDHLVDRALVGRDMTYLDFSFFLGIVNVSVEEASLRRGVLYQRALMTTSFPLSLLPAGQVPATVYWDPQVGRWRLVRDTCGVEEEALLGSNVRPDDATLIARLCSTRNAPAKVWNSTQAAAHEFFGTNTQFALVAIAPGFVNTPPAVTAAHLEVSEGRVIEYPLQYSDAERDVAHIRIVTPPARGTAEIVDNVLFYRPDCVRCRPYTVEVVVAATEVVQHEGPPAVSARSVVTIDVWPNNRPPVLLVRLPDGAWQKAGDGYEVAVAPSAEGVFRLPAVAAVDGSAVALSGTAPTGSLAWDNATAAAIAAVLPSQIDASLLVNNPTSVQVSALTGTFRPLNETQGWQPVHFEAVDESFLYSDPLTLSVYVDACYYLVDGEPCEPLTPSAEGESSCEARVCVTKSVVETAAGDSTASSLVAVIAGALVGLLLLLVVLFVVLYRRRRQRQIAAKKALALESQTVHMQSFSTRHFDGATLHSGAAGRLAGATGQALEADDGELVFLDADGSELALVEADDGEFMFLDADGSELVFEDGEDGGLVFVDADGEPILDDQGDFVDGTSPAGRELLRSTPGARIVPKKQLVVVDDAGRGVFDDEGNAILACTEAGRAYLQSHKLTASVRVDPSLYVVPSSGEKMRREGDFGASFGVRLNPVYTGLEDFPEEDGFDGALDGGYLDVQPDEPEVMEFADNRANVVKGLQRSFIMDDEVFGFTGDQLYDQPTPPFQSPFSKRGETKM